MLSRSKAQGRAVRRMTLRLLLATMPRRPLKCRVFCRIATRQRISFREPWAQGLSLSSVSDRNRCQVENGVDSQLSPEQASFFELS